MISKTICFRADIKQKIKKIMNYVKIAILFYFSLITLSLSSQAIIIDHNNAFLEPIPEWAIKKASDSLHIAYGHTSHGSQITYGMKALANQSTQLKGYKGDFYCWKEYHEVYGDNPCLDIDDKFRPGDLGHNGDITWATRTRDYLMNEDRAQDINVVMWSWCGGCSDNTDEGIQKYLDAMNQLEQDFPDIKFIYMTGHLDHWSDATLKHNNQLIRDYCIANNKILYDFADIESYDPDNNYYEFSNDNCDYYDANGNRLGNWAEEWQNSHILNEDWYQCSAAHSKPLNGNRKAYAAWWLWARLVGWNPNINNIEITQQPQNDTICDEGTAIFSIDFNNSDSLRWQIQTVDTLPFRKIFDNDTFSGTKTKALSINVTDNKFTDYKFRCIIYLGDTFAFTNSAKLTVSNVIEAFVQYDGVTCNDTVFLKGRDPAPGFCRWNVAEGQSIVDSPTQNETFAYGLSYGKNILEYVITNNSCKDTAIVQIDKYNPLVYVNRKITEDTDYLIEIDIEGDLEFAQWYKDEVALQNSTKYSGTNSLNLTIRNADYNDNGYYWCELNGYCNTEISDSILVDIVNATNNLQGSTKPVVYPNPATSILNVFSDKEIQEIEILDLNNNKIKSITYPATRIDITDLKTGLYFLKIKTNFEIFYTKIIVSLK